MKIDRWELIEMIFQRALESPPERRSEEVRALCGGDEELASEVNSLLRYEHEAEVELQNMLADELSALESVESSSEIGGKVGPYQLVRELDSGGMGVVYLAVRSDNQYFQIVAIKMIRRGVASSEVIQRFRDERQILATLTHPNIGVILDGGETEDGRPFIVMEYVEGQPITAASAARGLGVRQKIDLFRSVCSAVHHAHQKLIIHRDIKPDNVLVTPEGVVKLIDFGIAKPLVQESFLNERSPTESWQRLMTPDYASPEQLLGRQLSTATDVYSLGVLLFELLTGSRPYRLAGLSPGEAERVVLEEERANPSSVKDLPAQIRRELSGDLDTIILKALQQEPSRRYLSVQHLEEDLHRFLRGQPIAARRPSTLYVLGKLLKRYRTAMLVTSTSILMLAVFLFGYAWQIRVADRRVSEVRGLADSAISEMTDKLQQSSTSTEAQAALFHRALLYLNQLNVKTGDNPRLLLEISKAYIRVGDLEGSPFVANLGNSGTAVTSYQNALRTAMEAKDKLNIPESTAAVIKAHQRLGDIYTFLGDVRSATEEYQSGLALARPFWQKSPQDPMRIEMLTTIYAGMGDVALDKLRPDEALAHYLEATAISGDQPNGDEAHDRFLADLHLRRAAALNELGDQRETLRQVEEAIHLTEALIQRFPSSIQTRRELLLAYQRMVLTLSGRSFLNLSESKQAQVYARKMLQIAELLSVSDSRNAQASYDMAVSMSIMGDAYRQVMPEEAASWYRRSIALTKNLEPLYAAETKHRIAVRDEALADVLLRPKEAPERLSALREANQIRQALAETSPHGRLHLLGSYCKLSDAELSVNDISGAKRDADAALPLLYEFNDSSPSLQVLRNVGLCLETEGNLQRYLAFALGASSSEKRSAEEAARTYYRSSEQVWDEWVRRGAETPESKRESMRVRRVIDDLPSEKMRRL